MLSRLPERLQRRALKAYTEGVLRWDAVEVLCGAVAPFLGAKRRNLPEVPAAFLDGLGARATVLRSLPLYAPYHAAYRLDAPS
jgi:hypothetical protein